MSSERTWLVAILRRKIVDHFRAAGARRHDQELEGADTGSDPWFNEAGKWKNAVLGWPGDPASLISNHEFRQTLDECLSKLPPALADAFCLREMEELGTEDLCKVLNVSASNLCVRLHRARMLLRQCLEQNWFARGG